MQADLATLGADFDAQAGRWLSLPGAGALIWAAVGSSHHSADPCPEFLPRSLGIGLGLHWIVFWWIVAHPVGIIHAICRTLLVTSPDAIGVDRLHR